MRFLASLLLLLCIVGDASAQSTPGFVTGQVPTAAQWNSYFAAKQDYLGFIPAKSPCGKRISTGAADTAVYSTDANCSILWNSSTTSNKTETLYNCNSVSAWTIVTLVDEIGTATTFPVIVAPFSANTILKRTSYQLLGSFSSVQFQCDGTGNWVVL